MMQLPAFFGKITQDEDILHISRSIRANLLRVCVDTSGKGLALYLTLDGEIPDGRKLVSLENVLRSKWKADQIHIYLSGFPLAKIPKSKMIYPLLPWIFSSLKKENPLHALITENAHVVCEEEALSLDLCMLADEEHKDCFSHDFQGFCEKYMGFSCMLSYSQDKENIHQLAAERAKQMQQTLIREANEILLSQDNCGQASANIQDADPSEQQKKKRSAGTEHVKKSSGGSEASSAKNAASRKMDDMSESLNPDSWEYKAKLLAKENNTVFTRPKKADGILWGKVNPTLPILKIKDMNANTGMILFDGFVEIEELNLTKSGSKVRINFYVTDDTGCIACVYFMSPNDADEFEDKFGSGGYGQFQANVHYDDRFSHDLQASIEGVVEKDSPAKRKDVSEMKRVELHCHTKMSEKDAVIPVSDLFYEAARFGHAACAITDHGVVQGFPEAAETCKQINKKNPDKPFKVIFGMEGYLVDDGPCVAFHAHNDADFAMGFVALRVLTTGNDPCTDKLTEIAAVRFARSEDGKYFQEQTFHVCVSVQDAKTNESSDSPLAAVKAFSQFCQDLPICGYDVLRDLAFLRTIGFSVDVEKHEDYRVKFNSSAIDIIELARAFYPEITDLTLQGIREFLQIQDSQGDCATDEAKLNGIILIHVLYAFQIHSPKELNDKAGILPKEDLLIRKTKVYHVILLAQNALGLYNLYRLVSESHIEYFNMRPRIPRSELRFFQAGLIIGSACERGELFSRVYSEYIASEKNYERTLDALVSDQVFIRKLRMYDYFEIQPICNNEFYLRNPESGIKAISELQAMNRLITKLGDLLSIPVCATTDAHFLEKSDGEYRKYIMMDMGYKDANLQSALYFRTTPEMLQEFAYLGEDKAFEVVVANTNAIADRVTPGLKPFPDGTYPPIIETAADDVRDITWSSAKELYGFNGEISPIVRARVEKELTSIIGHGFAIMYYIAYKLVKKSNEDGYIVGSRGSVGSSLVATLCGISEVNPLPPHHVCPTCRFSDFDESGKYGSGYDLPPMKCPHCGTKMRCEGQDIPFETFLGFYGDKQPDIDLNFSSEYQSRAHKYVEELFGESHTFRAGTIGCYADKNAIAVVKKVQEQTGTSASKAELRRQSLGLIGVKRTTGQHPGGIVVVPKEMDVYEFTPIQHPANKLTCGIVTTHFDFNAMHDTILKLDILGHYDPTMLRMLSDLTGVDVRTIPIPDEKVMSLLVSTEALGIPDGTSSAKSATLGLSEMGTFMARDMIAETRPKQFYDLVQLMGLSHGTDVWKGNAQVLIQNHTCTLNSVIGCRDSIMTQLIYWGIPNKSAFDIMEKVRKGKGVSPEFEALMRENDVPNWYIDSCKKIKYMFPKAHAAAYAISSLRIAWFKVYYPEEYYCSYFTIRGDEFDGFFMCAGPQKAMERRKELFEGFVTRKPNEKSEYYLCELVEEMYARNITFLPYDIENSAAERFIKVEKNKILPPLNAIQTISAAVAQNIVEARKDGPFKSRDDVLRRSGIGPTALEALIASGCLDHLPDSAQIDLFSLM